MKMSSIHKKYKPGQLVTIDGHVYRFIKQRTCGNSQWVPGCYICENKKPNKICEHCDPRFDMILKLIK